MRDHAPKFTYFMSLFIMLLSVIMISGLLSNAVSNGQFDLVIVLTVFNGFVFFWSYFLLNKVVYFSKKGEQVELGNLFIKKVVRQDEVDEIKRVFINIYRVRIKDWNRYILNYHK